MGGVNYDLKWMFKQTKGSRFILFLLLLTNIINSVVVLLMSYIIKLFVDVASGDLDESLMKIALFSLMVVATIGLFYLIRFYLESIIYSRTELKYRVSLMNKIYSMNLERIEKFHSGELMTRLTNDIAMVSNIFINIFNNIVGGCTAAILAIVILFIVSWKMAIIMLISIPVLIISTSVFTPLMEKASKVDKFNEEINRTFMQENLSRLLLIKTYHMQNKSIGTMKSKYRKKAKSKIKVGLWQGYAAFANNTIGMGIFIIAMGSGSYFVTKGDLTVGSLVGIVQLTNFIVGPFSTISKVIANIGDAKASAKRLGEILDMPVDESTHVMPSENRSRTIKLSTKNLDFSYNESEKVLDNVNISFETNGITGIIGKSGSGKSTLLKLLMGVYPPNKGKVTFEINDELLEGIEILPRISYVPSDNFLFSGSIKENICMAEDVNNERLIEATRESNIYDFIRELPDGFDTILTEGGNNLSSGQAQRIAIARSLYKRCSILIMDEPTANLDVESIQIFQDTIKSLSKDLICIVVTHDISTKEIFNKIYTIEGNTVVENDVLALDDLKELG